MTRAKIVCERLAAVLENSRAMRLLHRAASVAHSPRQQAALLATSARAARDFADRLETLALAAAIDVRERDAVRDGIEAPPLAEAAE